jgi:ABC-type transport system substrate-binding protein
LQERKGVQFHTGCELTEQDAQWNFVRAAIQGAKGLLAPKLTLLDRLATPDALVSLGDSWPAKPAATD